MADAADDRDVKLQLVAGGLFATFKANLDQVLFADGPQRQLNTVVLLSGIEGARAVVGLSMFTPYP